MIGLRPARTDPTLAAAVLDMLETGAILLDAEHRVLCWNAWMARASGLAAQEAIGRDVFELFPGLEGSRLAVAVREAFATGAASVLTHWLNPALLPLRRGDDRALHHSLTIRPMPGEPAACLVQVADVTAAVERERVLRLRRDARFRAVVDTAPDAILTTDAAGRIEWANPAVERQFGLAERALAGQEIGALLPEGGARWAAMAARPGPAGGAPERFEATGRRADGTTMALEVSVSRWAADSHVFATGILRDVTERRQAEAALREGEARFRALVEAMPQFAFSALPDGRNDFISQGWYDYTGQAPITGEGDGWAAALHPEDLERTFAGWRGVLASGGRYEIEHRFRSREGEYRWFLTRAVALRDEADGRILRWFGASTDISEIVAAREAAASAAAELERLVEERTAALLRAAEERRRAEEAMRQGEKLAALGQLTGGVAHDFGNLLQVVSSGVSLLQRPTVAGDRKAAVLEGMIQATQNARELIRRLLTFARQQALRPETFSLNERLEGMSQLLRQTLGARIRVETSLGAGLWPVHADPSQLEIAVLNLAVNARDAMPEGGTLLLQTRNAVLEATPERPAGDYVCLSVRDTGQGMPPAVLARVFEPFFTTKEVGKGTGLGLPQVHGFAKQSGGDIHVESTPGQGTTVTIHLPRRAEPVGAPPPGHQPGAVLDSLRSSGGRTILVVDDNAAAGEFAAALLEELGYATRRADSMATALAVFAEGGRIDAVFSDVVMPGGMSGIELARVLRATHPQIPVLLASGYSAPLARGGAPEGVEILAKPYVLDELAAALERAFAAPAAEPGGGRPWITPTAPPYPGG